MANKHDPTSIKKGVALLAKRAYSRGELRKKVAPIGKQDPVIEKTLDRLEQLNLLNDHEYAYNFALHHIRQGGWGPAKVKETLCRRDVATDVIRHAIERVLSEIDIEALLIEYIGKHCRSHGSPTNPKDIKKLALHLMRRGFEENQIKSALKQTIPPDAFRCFETGD
jgi:regulatory protein